jgi:hypothetical protein
MRVGLHDWPLVTARPDGFQFMAALLSLAAVLAVLVNGFIQIYLCPLEVTPAIRPSGRRHSRQQHSTQHRAQHRLTNHFPQ